MRITRIAIILLLGTLLVSGLACCTDGAEPETTPTPTPTDFADVIITMYRSVCFGACPVYSLTIYGNGTVVYEGEMYVNVIGKQTSEISQEKIQEIVDEFYRIDYFSLDDVYDEPISDIQHKITSIRINGKYKSIYNRWGAPMELNELENKIDEITNSKQWVSGE